MFAGKFFAKTYFRGNYFPPVEEDGGPGSATGGGHYVGQQCNLGTLMGRR